MQRNQLEVDSNKPFPSLAMTKVHAVVCPHHVVVPRSYLLPPSISHICAILR